MTSNVAEIFHAKLDELVKLTPLLRRRRADRRHRQHARTKLSCTCLGCLAEFVFAEVAHNLRLLIDPSNEVCKVHLDDDQVLDLKKVCLIGTTDHEDVKGGRRART